MSTPGRLAATSTLVLVLASLLFGVGQIALPMPTLDRTNCERWVAGKDSSVATAWGDLVSRPPSCSLKMEARHQQLAGSTTARLPALFQHSYEVPKAYLSDIDEDEETYPNGCVASFWDRTELSLDRELRLEPFHLRESW